MKIAAILVLVLVSAAVIAYVNASGANQVTLEQAFNALRSVGSQIQTAVQSIVH